MDALSDSEATEIFRSLGLSLFLPKWMALVIVAGTVRCLWNMDDIECMSCVSLILGSSDVDSTNYVL